MQDIMLCHGSPYRVNEHMVPGAERTKEIVEQSGQKLILCGHTHKQAVYEYKGKRVLNPGSVGSSLGSGGKAQFLLLDEGRADSVYELLSLDYDVDTVIRELYEEEVDKHAPYWCYVTENSLRTGNSNASHGKVLARAMALCESREGSCNWPNIAEKYMKQAVEELVDGYRKDNL